MNELATAIMTKIRSGGAASDVYEAVSSDFYYGQVPADVSMPYITFDFLSTVDRRCFSAGASFDETAVSFTIYDDRRVTSDVAGLVADLDGVFNRATLTFGTQTHVGCSRASIIGPTRMEDCWQTTADYLVNYK